MAFGNVPRVGHSARPIQVRYFQEPDIAELETRINEWLADDARREIVEIRQSVCQPKVDELTLIVSIWYIEA
jgi:hypothetical protein